LAPSGNIHPGKISLFEPVHGSAPTIAGKNLANPAGAVLASALMLDHLGLASQADAVRKAVRTAVREKHTTIDLGGTLGTREAGDWLAEYITKNPA
jgi:3-isopropylmalate dehydrogenase